MKKIFALFLSVSICCLLFGCSENTLSSSGSTSSANASAQDSSFANISSEHEENTTPSQIEPSSSKSSSKVNPPAVSSVPRQETVTVLIPPGFSVKQIAERMEACKVCSKKDFLSAVNEGDFSSFPLVNQITNLSKRCYRLEGYLYPDTYEFYTDSSAESVIRKILQNTENKISDKYRYSDKTIDEIITIASLIEKEGGGGSEGNKIAAVIYNRLKKGTPLQLDATVNYLENQLEPADTQKFKTYYNTYNRNPKNGEKYQCPGLPAGPICSPSANSLKAAVNPVQEDFFFFSSNGNVYTFQTEEEWIAANKPQDTESKEEQQENAD